MNNEQDKQLLNKMHQNVEMATDGIDMVYDHIENSNMRELLSKHRKSYASLKGKIERIISERGFAPDDVPVMAKVSSTVVGTMKNLAGQGDRDYAKDIIKGATSGVTTLTGHVHSYKGGDEKIVALANEIIKCEEKNIEDIKAYL